MKIEFDSWDIEKALEEHLEKHYNLKVNLQDQELAPLLEVQLYEEEKDKEGNSVINYSKPIKNKREYTEIIQESWISFYIN
jgi:hypothetical protein